MGRIRVWFIGSVVRKLDHDAYPRRCRHWLGRAEFAVRDDGLPC